MARKRNDDIIEISEFNQGGLADSKHSGLKSSLYKFTGWDPHSKPGILKVAQAMAKFSAETVTADIRVAVSSSNGAQYWFSYTDGKIWEITAGGTLRLVYTTTPAAGTAGCSGAMEYQGRIYWATQSRLHYITVAHADDNNWAANAVEDFATFTKTDTAFHPMMIQNQVLYIGDGNYIAQVNETTFSANALDIATPLRVKSLGKIGTDLLVGTYIADTVTETQIIRWNTFSVSFTSSDSIPEVGINAFIPSDNNVLVQAGNQGNIYYYDGLVLEPYMKIPGSFSPTAYGEVYPNAVASANGQLLFGFSNGSGNPADQLIYRIGRNSRNYPLIMDAPYPISERSSGALVTSGISIGAILVVGNDIYCSWKNSTTYGIDKLNWSAKLTLAYLESRVMVTEREKYSNFTKFDIAYSSMPTSCSLSMLYDKNYEGYVAFTNEIDDTARNIVEAEEAVEATTLQLKVTATVSGNTAPEIESIAIFQS